MECKKCKRAIGVDYEFCPYCGAKNGAQSCEGCSSKVEDDYIFCPKCGQGMAKNEQSSSIAAQNDIMQTAIKASKPQNKFFEYEKQTGVLKNSITLLFAFSMLLCAVFGGFTADIYSINSYCYPQSMLGISQFDYLVSLFSNVYMNNPISAIFNVLLGISSVACIILPVPFIIMLIIKLAKKQHLKNSWKLGKIGLWFVFVVFFLISVLMSNIGVAVSGGRYIAYALFAALILVGEILVKILYEKSFKLSLHTIIKRSALAALCITLLATNFLNVNAAMFEVSSMYGETTKLGTISGTQFITVSYLIFNGDETVVVSTMKAFFDMENVSALMPQLIAGVRYASTSPINVIVGVMSIFIAVLQTITYFLLLGMLLKFICSTIHSKEETAAKNGRMIVILVLMTIALLGSIALTICFNKMYATPIPLHVGGGVITNVILIIGFIVFNAVFKYKSKKREAQQTIITKEN